MKPLRFSIQWYTGLLSLLVMSYIISRAVICGITYDEVWTLSGFVPYSWGDILRFEPCDANNHLLNTLCIKVLYTWLPNTLFVARLPNIAGGLLYLYFSSRLSQRYAGWTGLLCFSILVLNPFLLEFFSLARGYGLALGLLTGGLYYGIRFYEERKLSALGFSLFFFSLSVTAALSYLHLYLAAQVVFFMLLIRGEKTKRLIGLGLQATMTLLLAWLLYQPIQKLRANDNLYYGGKTGLFQDTLLSLSAYLTGSIPAGSEQVFGLILFLGLLLFLLIRLHFRPTHFSSGFYFFIPLLILTLSSITAQFYLLKTLYVTDRTALFLYPLFMLVLSELILCSPPDRLQKVMTMTLVLAFSFNFMRVANVYKTSTWFFDAHSEEVIRTIVQKENKQPVNLQFSWPISKSLMYYQSQLGANISNSYKSREQAMRDGDYYLYLDAAIDQVDYARGREQLISADKDTLLSFPKEQLYLFKLKARHD